VNYCPSGYNGTPCTLTGGEELAISYMFNLPTNTFVNEGSGGAGYNITTGRQAVKNRGIQFDGATDT
jgi:hypothetical protein